MIALSEFMLYLTEKSPMKLTNAILYIIFFTLNSSFAKADTSPITKDNKNINRKQQSDQESLFSYFNLSPKTIAHFFHQPKYSASNIKCFLRHTYNHPAYAQKFLAVNFSHVKTFLSYTDKSPQPRGYIESVLSLFKQKIKVTPYINSYACIEFLEHMPSLMQEYFNEEKEKQEKINNIKELIHEYLYSNFNRLKHDPEDTLNDMSEKIYDLTVEKPNEETDISINKLQQTIISFLETSLNKLIWSPLDQKEIWESVKLIANQLEDLLLQNIIPNIETLDELYWTLINRFCYFLEISGNELNMESYELINNDIITQKSLLWTLKEREPHVTSKYRHLKYHLMLSEAKARAYSAGIIADVIN